MNFAFNRWHLDKLNSLRDLAISRRISYREFEESREFAKRVRARVADNDRA